LLRSGSQRLLLTLARAGVVSLLVLAATQLNSDNVDLTHRGCLCKRVFLLFAKAKLTLRLAALTFHLGLFFHGHRGCAVSLLREVLTIGFSGRVGSLGFACLIVRRQNIRAVVSLINLQVGRGLRLELLAALQVDGVANAREVFVGTIQIILKDFSVLGFYSKYSVPCGLVVHT
jgi:hypothetical protein